jgi:rhodanese-related sulfurtransferase
MRSQQVANFLIQQGINNVINLSGGVDAWALSVEPDMPRY